MRTKAFNESALHLCADVPPGKRLHEYNKQIDTLESSVSPDPRPIIRSRQARQVNSHKGVRLAATVAVR